MNKDVQPYHSHNHHLLAVKGCVPALDVLAFKGDEALSKPFSYRIEFTCTDHALGKEMMLLKAASLTLQAPVDQGYGIKMQQPVRVIQAQGDEMTLDALKDIRISSSEGKLVISAKQEIILTSGGGYIRIAEGTVECAGPDKIIQRADVWQKFGGQSMSLAAQSWESADFAVTPEVWRLSDNSPVAGLKLGLTNGDGTQQSLTTSAAGTTGVQNNINIDSLNASWLDKT